jgi:DNA repair protein RecN (Recombination protein N)
MGRLKRFSTQMLISLSIQNYALIQELSLEFAGGLVILTGETGAGKSIIIDAFGLLLGDRASTEVIRSGATKAVVEGVFGVSGYAAIKALLERNELDTGDTLIARRELSAKGQSRCFLNDTPVTLALLKEAGDLLVDLHGQHEHQSLLRTTTHIEMLDAFCQLDGELNKYRDAYRTLASLLAKMNHLRKHEAHLREMRDYHSFQLREIDAVAPRSGEEDELVAESRILENFERLLRETKELYDDLYGETGSAYERLATAENRLQALAQIDTRFEGMAKEVHSAAVVVTELARVLQEYASGADFNPDRLEQVRTQLGQLSVLRKKYGGTLDAVIAYRERIAGELSETGSIDEEIAKVTSEIEEERKMCGTMAARLSTKRRGAVKLVEREILSELSALGIPYAQFVVRIQQPEVDSASDARASYTLDSGKVVDLNDRGFDEVEFLICTNRGEELKPLSKVVSGGEISRIMLALKGILAKNDRLPLMVFDEIDVGVSGRVAQAVGLKLRKLSKSHQVIAITHLPQIAGLADQHFGVYKSEEGKRTTTHVRLLSPEERVQEVAKLLSGAKVTEAAIKGARELMRLPAEP